MQGSRIIYFLYTGETKSADELLKQRFAAVKQDPQAFSSIKYVGTKTLNDSTDFQALFRTVIELTNDSSVRSRRPLGVIYDVLNVRCLDRTKLMLAFYSNTDISPDVYFNPISLHNHLPF